MNLCCRHVMTITLETGVRLQRIAAARAQHNNFITLDTNETSALIAIEAGKSRT
jgi:hypothetical protein